MDRNRLALLIRILLIFHFYFYVNASSGDLLNVRTDSQLLDSTSVMQCSANCEPINTAGTRKGDGNYVSAKEKGVKRSSRIRGARGQGILMGSHPRRNASAEVDAELSIVALGVRAESATVVAHKVFQSYLERSDYFRSRRAQYVPPPKKAGKRGQAPGDSFTPLGRRKLARTLDSTRGSTLDKGEIEHDRKVFQEPFMYLVVSQAGDGDFSTVQDAVDFVREGNSQRVIIRIRAGFYREKVVVPRNKPFITFHGDGTRSTIISWNATAASREAVAAHFFNASEGLGLFGTMQSASVTVLSDYFVAQNITFKNSAPAPDPGAEDSQAVAFLLAGDYAALYDSSFLGAQDTLYDYKGRHYYHGCFIQGSIDFIFGNGRSLFENCTLSSIATKFGAIAAQQRRTPDEDTGFVFVGCYVTGTGAVYLGRAWSRFAKIVFARSYFEDIIDAEGWNDFGDPGRHDTTYFGLYKCSGPGANMVRLVPWSRNLTGDEVRPYLSRNYVNGQEWLVWDPRDQSIVRQDSLHP